MNYNNLLPIDKFYVASTNESWLYEQPQTTPIATHHVSLTKDPMSPHVPTMNPRNVIKNIVPLEVPPINPSTPIYVNKANSNKKGPLIPTFNFHMYKCFKKKL